jgi:toxin YhaV
MTGPPVQVHGWRLFAHPLFLAQVQALSQQVETLQHKDPVGYVNKNASKRLSAIIQLAFDTIAQDPTRPEYRQGNTLGGQHKYWFRAKFFQQHRLFFRYHAVSKVIVFAWVNDKQTKRACVNSSLTHLSQHRLNYFFADAKVARVQACKEVFGRIYQPLLFGKTNHRRSACHPNTQLFSDGSACAFIHQHQALACRQ